MTHSTVNQMPAAKIRESRIPASFCRATWRSTTPLDTENQEVGFSLGTPTGPVRYALDTASAQHLSTTLQESLAGALDVAPTLRISRAQLQAALHCWEAEAREGRMLSAEESSRLTVGQRAEQSTDYLWGMLCTAPLAETLAGVHSTRSCGMPSTEVSPQDALNVWPPATSSAAITGF